ncbi:uncharacterized protein LOC116116323 [Pistacia vera]|uniref:uncharacterized protein LOC116116323 n=1 Tax=Pistacia vera TaxID=55513 RepID=UPI001263877A|nr:uncharacterized protein LOC116116323 [Pistacia vera]
MLNTTKKESQSMNDYVLRMKEFADKLNASGVHIEDEELLMYILDGLGSEYDVVIANLTSTVSQITFQEAPFLLHKHELRLERQNSALLTFHEQMSSALMVAKTNTSEGTASLSRVSSGIPSQQGPPLAHFQGSSRRGYSKTRLMCQVCGKPDHSALHCYHRFDQDYQGFPNASYGNPGHQSYVNYTGANQQVLPIIQHTYSTSANETPQAMYAGTIIPVQYYNNHVGQFHDYSAIGAPAMHQLDPSPAFTMQASHQFSQSPSGSSTKPDTILPTGHADHTLATPQIVKDHSWYMDSGASNHMTADTNTMLMTLGYSRGSKVQVGNGKSLPITHTSMVMLPSSDCHKILHLKNILCAPKIAKKLLSISQITKDNNVSVEFYYDHCLVKDRGSKAILLQGTVKHGLYQLDIPFTAASSVVASVNSTTASNKSASLHSPPVISSSSYRMSNKLLADSQCLNSIVDNSLSVCKTTSTLSSTFSLWHARLGHLSTKALHYVLTKLNVKFVADVNKNTICEACAYGKLSQCSFPSSNSRAHAPLDLVYSDL